MAIPGGSAAKWGELYEGRWTVFTLLRVLDEDADAIRIEQPGEDFAEFVVRTKGETEYHQAKRAYAQSGRWSIKTLLRQGVLVPFKEKLESGGHNGCVFVSGQDALQEVSSAKLLACRVAVEVADDAVQLHGGYGYMREYDVERALRDARLGPIGGGTDEVMKEIIGKQLGL